MKNKNVVSSFAPAVRWSTNQSITKKMTFSTGFSSLNITQLVVHIYDNYKHNRDCIVPARCLLFILIICLILSFYWFSLLFNILSIRVRWIWFTRQKNINVQRVSLSRPPVGEVVNTTLPYGLANHNAKQNITPISLLELYMKPKENNDNVKQQKQNWKGRKEGISVNHNKFITTDFKKRWYTKCGHTIWLLFVLLRLATVSCP